MQEEAHQDSVSKALPIISITEKDIKKTLSRLEKNLETATTRDLDVICFGLRNPKFSADCARMLERKLAPFMPGLFTSSHLDALFNGLYNPNIAIAERCANAIEDLAASRADLFAAPQQIKQFEKAFSNPMPGVLLAGAANFLIKEKPEAFATTQLLNSALSHYGSLRFSGIPEKIASAASEQSRSEASFHDKLNESMAKELGFLGPHSYIWIPTAHPDQLSSGVRTSFESILGHFTQKAQHAFTEGSMDLLIAGLRIKEAEPLYSRLLFNLIGEDVMFGYGHSKTRRKELFTSERLTQILSAYESGMTAYYGSELVRAYSLYRSDVFTPEHLATIRDYESRFGHDEIVRGNLASTQTYLQNSRPDLFK